MQAGPEDSPKTNASPNMKEAGTAAILPLFNFSICRSRRVSFGQGLARRGNAVRRRVIVRAGWGGGKFLKFPWRNRQPQRVGPIPSPRQHDRQVLADPSAHLKRP